MKNLTFKSVVKYAAVFACFSLSFYSIAGVPVGVAFLPAFLCAGFSFGGVFVAFLLAAVLCMGFAGGLAFTVSAAFLCAVYLVYKKRGKTVKFEQFVYLSIALAPYLFLPSFKGSVTEKLIYSAAIIVTSFVASAAVRAVAYKQLKRKYFLADVCAIAASIIVVFSGFINLFSVKAFECVAVFVVLVACAAYKSPRAILVAFVFSLPPAISEFSAEYIAVYEIYCVVALALIKRSKLLASIGQVVCSFAVVVLSDSLSMSITDYVFTFLPAVCFLFTPKSALNYLSETACAFDEKDVIRETINDERRMLAAKLYSLSSALCDLERAAAGGEKLIPSARGVAESACEAAVKSVCGECSQYRRCFVKNGDRVKSDVLKIAEVGFNKGKAGLVDLPKDFSEYCCFANSFLYEINEKIAIYGDEKEKIESARNRGVALFKESGGIGEILKNLSYELSAKIDFGRKTEKTVADILASEGIAPDAVICFGAAEYHVLFSDKNADFNRAAKAIERASGQSVGLSSKIDLGRGVMCVFKKAPAFDASFGVAGRTKYGSELSGDVHSLIKIDRGKFLVALCDGMGSGESARESSELAVGLIESLSRAGLDSESVADLANSLLSIPHGDAFSAADVAIIDLYAGICSVVKLGATFGLIVTDDGVKVLENSSLPLGVCEDTVHDSYALELKGGEIIVIMSDGISDAFFSSVEAVEFIEREKTSNPQALAERILCEAINRCNGKPNDDMTCIAVKIYKKSAA